jgi:hypothetical protein
LDDIPDTLMMAWEFGAVEVFQVTAVPEEGFTIGGNEASGGSNLYAAVEEDKLVDKQTTVVKYELEQKCLVVRWCDDLVQVWDKNVTKGTKELLFTLRGREFYGLPLTLENQGRKADEAFGFRLLTGGGVLRLAPILQFGEEVLKGCEAQRTRPLVQSGKQFSPVVRQVAAIAGRLIRAMDMCNGPEPAMLGLLARVVAEILIAEYDPVVVRRAVRKVQGQAWLKVDLLIRMTYEPAEAWVKFACEYDRVDREEREADYQLRRAELVK